MSFSEEGMNTLRLGWTETLGAEYQDPEALEDSVCCSMAFST